MQILPDWERYLQSLTIELHCHSYHSSDCLMDPERILEVCQRRGIDRIAITDHNTIRGALEAAAIDHERVIIGEEIKTSKGELLAYFVQEEVPSGLDPETTIELLRSQGAFISVSHPLDAIRSGAWKEGDLREILHLVDALEVYNSRSWTARPDRRARALADRCGLLRTAGSDAHSYGEIGRAVMKLPPFHDVEGFRQSLAMSEILGRRSWPVVHLLSRYASIKKALAPGVRTGQRSDA